MKARLRGARRHLVMLAGVVAPIAAAVSYVARLGNAGPVGDQWFDTVHIAIRTQAGTLSPSDLFVYFSGHRPVLIRLQSVLLTLLTGYDIRLARFAAIAKAVLTLGLLATLLVRHLEEEPAAGQVRRWPLLMAPGLLAIVLFTLHAADSWLDFYYSLWQEPLLCLAAGGLAIDRLAPGWKPFAIALLCAAASTLSLGLGTLAWGALALMLFVRPFYRQRRYVAAWLAAALVAAALYASPLARRPYEMAEAPRVNAAITAMPAYLLQYAAARFEMASLGTPVSARAISVALGSLLALLCGVSLVLNARQVLVRRPLDPAIVTWLALALFAVAGAVLSTLGRGVVLPVPIRYAPGGDGYWVAFVAITCLSLARGQGGRRLAMFNGTLLVVFVTLSIAKDGWALLLADDNTPAACDQVLREYPHSRTSAFRDCFPYADEASPYQLAALRLSLFRERPAVSVVQAGQASVISVLPHAWLTTYVRDYLVPTTPRERQFHVAPRRGAMQPAVSERSPFAGSFGIDQLPDPPVLAGEQVADLLPRLDLAASPRWIVFVTPQTADALSRLARECAAIGYAGTRLRASHGPMGLETWCYAPAGACGG